MMETSGLWMLAAVACVMLATGLPSWIALCGVALAFAAAGIAAGAFTPSAPRGRSTRAWWDSSTTTCCRRCPCTC